MTTSSTGAFPVIGVVGGMGPYAGLDLFERLLDHTVATRDQEHLPILVASFPHRIPDRSAFLNGAVSVNPADPMLDVLARLDRAGATVAGVPCVTAHAPQIFGPLREALRRSSLSIRLLSIVDETIRTIRETYPDVRRVAALSTTATFERRLLLDPLAAAGFTVVEQDHDVQAACVQQAIFDPETGIKAVSNPVAPATRSLLLDAVGHVEERGAQAVVLGCTELPLAIPETRIGDMIFVNPTTALARGLIRETYPERLKPVQAAVAVP